MVSLLGLLTGQVGDTWMYGCASDPLKLAKMRAIVRAHGRCHRALLCRRVRRRPERLLRRLRRRRAAGTSRGRTRRRVAHARPCPCPSHGAHSSAHRRLRGQRRHRRQQPPWRRRRVYRFGRVHGRADPLLLLPRAAAAACS